ncbi:YifB family Mg chelatase-like AAA ATPase [Acetobacter lambici]|uniref:YifB family Mg chelatase-like AAA ATPase n=1 Tax=Acetobacter lambici TaxID=1332824 RepID=A0ABT1EYC4_9PROT|nr:YifB family Mg chelatase-like AAA ATPase [Acetobacter lambici]MCP1241296.1 YifB family Mg chelatase-like AAA ATPase [Acetobacter lambici]MCP1257034.1 YifB family Mg chelatase-like AAA ATPase [Acetobacter lambici]NHO55527.1 YifB family Mg chelatase-like AAA ATPase [Acetobacter lambici]
MIYSRIRSFAFSGIEARPVWVEVQISSGLPAFLVVGLPDKAVAEARERVRAALTAIGLALPAKRILVNLVPADLPKEGSHFDLPIALALLAAMGVIPAEEVGRYAALGELSLDGRLNPVSGVLSASLEAASMELGIACPAQQGEEALCGGDIAILAAPDLLALINHFTGLQILSSPVFSSNVSPPDTSEPDLADIKGMETGRRALEIAAAGGHSLLLSGPPGAGKSMLAARLRGLLPDLLPSESLAVSRIYSAAGLLKDGRPMRRPPVRDPHHSASLPALVGGGARARPGEISLAHHGVLFLDELPEFSRAALEALRQPLETGQVSIARAAVHVTYPARFQLIAAMNPCRCGYMGDATRECSKAPRCGADYLARLSGPLMDRIDLHVAMQPYEPLGYMIQPDGEKTATVALRVANARARQTHRQGAQKNAEAALNVLSLTKDGQDLAQAIAERFRFSARGYTRLLRVARTIADLADAPDVEAPHIAEAATFRARSTP